MRNAGHNLLAETKCVKCDFTIPQGHWRAVIAVSEFAPDHYDGEGDLVPAGRGHGFTLTYCEDCAGVDRAFQLPNPWGPDEPVPEEPEDDRTAADDSLAALSLRIAKRLKQCERKGPGGEARRVMELWSDGLSQAEIAGRLGISQPSVSRLLRRAFEGLA